ncbi:hypothetical protein HC031_18160 [Planosporangium thailandense]|uniref:Uncharacterized protein n=1 Tax=Planosporangium thailandense TaxID=765197 RepID=A0ABX0Y0R5_9ACTN|nr:hypothetical protein [Planosporangium thailandense]NJC71628.1 hypothetical protein [Planosporangium thailandense]
MTGLEAPGTDERPRTAGAALSIAGKPAHNRHFNLSRDVIARAEVRAKQDGVSLAEVLRAGLDEYIDGMPDEAKTMRPGDPTPLPHTVVEAIREVWVTGERDRQNAFLSLLTRAGWSQKVLADGLVASGIVSSMSRQGVHHRVHQAPAELPDGLPVLAVRPPLRRPHRGQPGGAHDFSLRIADDQYALATQRATYEGSQMTAVLEDIFIRYAAGEFSLEA